MTEVTLTVRELRRLWKPQKERLNSVQPENGTNIRFHRACSWLQRCEDIQNEDAFDSSLLCLWTAFNALYGQWDGERLEPVPDVECWSHFLERMLELDQGELIQRQLEEHKKLVMTLFDDEYLSRYFWQDPSDQRAKRVRRSKFEAQTWYAESNWLMILEKVFERIYLLRCQLVHGASSYNGKLNRVSVRRCTLMMDHLLRTFLQIWARWGADQDWGIMCYPPMQ